MLSGTLNKMRVERNPEGLATYYMRLGDQEIPMESYIGQTLQMEFLGDIFCAACGGRTNKSFSQGYCFKHARTLAACDLCIVRPETCHHHLGTCREPEWGQAHCMIPHTVYLSNSSGVKVGITRSHQRLTRWMDQGAVQAIPLVEVPSRWDAGKVEVALAKHIMDKTNWRTMLKGEVGLVDLRERAEEILSFLPEGVSMEKVQPLEEVRITYPVLEYPDKITSHNFDKNSVVSGTLLGIKGQYLIFDTGVINIRKFTSYQIKMSDPPAATRPLGAVARPEEVFVAKRPERRRPIEEIPRSGPYGSW